MKKCKNLCTVIQSLFEKYEGTKYFIVAEQIKWPGGRLYEDLEAEESLDTIIQLSRDPEKYGFPKPTYAIEFLEFSMLNVETLDLRELPEGKPKFFKDEEIKPGQGVMYVIEKGKSGIKVIVYDV